MSAVTAPDAHTTRAAAGAPAYRLSFARVVRSEWIKLFSVRSTWWTLSVVAVLTVGISALVAAQLESSRTMAVEAGESSDFASVMAIVMPMQFTMLVAGILGAIAITGEYSTGMIRSTLTAEPRRGRVLIAKAVVVAAAMALATAIIFAVSVVVTAPLMGENGIDWSDPERSLIPLAAGVFAMISFALLGLGFGFLIRNGAGAIASTVGVLFVLPIVTNMFVLGGDAWKWIVDLGEYLPMSAMQVAVTAGGDDVLRGILTLAAWPVALQIGRAHV